MLHETVGIEVRCTADYPDIDDIGKHRKSWDKLITSGFGGIRPDFFLCNDDISIFSPLLLIVQVIKYVIVIYYSDPYSFGLIKIFVVELSWVTKFQAFHFTTM